MKAEGEIRGIALFINLGGRGVWVVNAIHPPFYTRKVFRNAVFEARWVPGSFWTGFGEKKIPCSTKSRTPTSPARIEPTTICRF